MNIRDYYRRLSAENRGHFWNIATSCIVAIITFWVGLSIQYIVYNKGAEESERLAHYQVVDKIYPMYLDFYESNKEIMSKLLISYNSDESMEQVLNTIETDSELILKTARQSVESAGKIMPYLKNEAHQSVMNNNAQILVGLKLDELLKQRDLTHIKDSLLSYMISGDYMLLAGYNKNIKEITHKAEELKQLLENISIKENKSHSTWDVLQRKIYIDYILIPVIKNELKIREELYSNETSFWDIIVYCVSCLIICLLIGYLIFVFLVRKAFVPDDFRYSLSPEEVRIQTNKLRTKEEECSRLKASLFAKDLEIEKQGKELQNKTMYIASLENKIKNLGK